MRNQERPPVHPGRVIRDHYLKPLKLSVTNLADILGVSRKTASRIVNERSSMTPDLALRLSQAFDTTPQLWLGLQQEFDLWHAQQKHGWKNVTRIKADSETERPEKKRITFRLSADAVIKIKDLFPLIDLNSDQIGLIENEVSNFIERLREEDEITEVEALSLLRKAENALRKAIKYIDQISLGSKRGHSIYIWLYSEIALSDIVLPMSVTDSYISDVVTLRSQTCKNLFQRLISGESDIHIFRKAIAKACDGIEPEKNQGNKHQFPGADIFVLGMAKIYYEITGDIPPQNPSMSSPMIKFMNICLEEISDYLDGSVKDNLMIFRWDWFVIRVFQKHKIELIPYWSDWHGYMTASFEPNRIHKLKRHVEPLISFPIPVTGPDTKKH
jgi:addiction module HigA family antidote